MPGGSDAPQQRLNSDEKECFQLYLSLYIYRERERERALEEPTKHRVV